MYQKYPKLFYACKMICLAKLLERPFHYRYSLEMPELQILRAGSMINIPASYSHSSLHIWYIQHERFSTVTPSTSITSWAKGANSCHVRVRCMGGCLFVIGTTPCRWEVEPNNIRLTVKAGLYIVLKKGIVTSRRYPCPNHDIARTPGK